MLCETPCGNHRGSLLYIKSSQNNDLTFMRAVMSAKYQMGDKKFTSMAIIYGLTSQYEHGKYT